MFTLENEYLKIEINAKGAELNSIYNKKKDIEYMWSGDPAFWGKKSPVLFPIIGSLKNDTYYFENKAYQMGRHGFARDMEFEVTNQNASAITFTLIRNNVTLEKYPFQFKFDIIYSIKDKKLQVAYRVVNKGDINQKLYFSVGGHPAFKLPVLPGTDYTDYWLEFNKKENAGRWPISAEGLIKEQPIPLMSDTHRLPLVKELFYTDAIVLKKLNSTSVKLASSQYGEIFDFDFTGFPYLGIWAAKGADFVCIEPWCGIADSVNSNQQLIEKEGINVLDSTDQFERSWTFTAY